MGEIGFDREPSPRGELDEFCLRNWQKLPADKREACLAVLREKTPADMLANWRAQYAAGFSIGSDDAFFHMGVGMQVRNALRAVLKDDELPEVAYPDGERHRNWDDFYFGALQELASQ